MNKLIVGGVVAGGAMVVMAGCVIGAGLAKADPGTDVAAYQRTMREDGWGGSEIDALKLGLTNCGWLRDGDSEAKIVARLAAPPKPMNKIDAYLFVSAAHTFLCPAVPGGPGEVPTTRTTTGVLGPEVLPAGWSEKRGHKK